MHFPEAGVGTWVVLRIPRRHRLDGRTEGLDAAFAGAERNAHLLPHLCEKDRAEDVRHDERHDEDVRDEIPRDGPAELGHERARDQLSCGRPWRSR